MKNFLFTLIFLLIAGSAYTQIDCKPYLPTTVGTVWELTNYSDKGKETGRIAYELVDKKESGNEITFTIKMVSYDKKGKEIFSNTSDAKCVDGKFEFDMSVKMDGSSLQAYEGMDVEVDASQYEVPTMDAAVGTKLADGSLKVVISGAIGMSSTVLVTDRKVEAKETVTTAAGTFDCLVISQNISTKMVVSINGASKEWYAENVGLIKSESYNKKGKMTGYSELTKLETP